MAGLLRRWRAPVLGGVAVFILSFPLLISHPAPVILVAAHGVKTADAEAGDHRLFAQQAREQRAALAAAQALEAAANPAQPASVPAVAAVHRVAPAPPPAPAAAVVRANTIVIPRLGLSQSVGWYSDCLGRAPVPRWGTWRWSCAGANNIYVMAHNPGIFTPILGLRAGDIVKYGDPAGRVHTYRVSYTTIVSNTQLWPLGATSGSSLTLQTCWTWDGSRDFIVRALEI
ncbi:MAG TPA: sortase [Candidatus Dormibacteraeota bacterium]|nr:sortase [Candidatus Dormibacteraeota bacterium]